MRKCIISTNIAETSITIPNVRYVIDSGKVRAVCDTDLQSKELSEPSLANSAMLQLHECYIAQANARQRAGRAGRTGPGVCYRLYTEDDYYEMTEYQLPEMLHGCVDDSVLLVFLLASLHIIPPSIHSLAEYPLLDTPSDLTIRRSTQRLLNYRAIGGSGPYSITSLGCILSSLPLSLPQGYFLILVSFLKQPYLGSLLCATMSFQVRPFLFLHK